MRLDGAGSGRYTQWQGFQCGKRQKGTRPEPREKERWQRPIESIRVLLHIPQPSLRPTKRRSWCRWRQHIFTFLLPHFFFPSPPIHSAWSSARQGKEEAREGATARESASCGGQTNLRPPHGTWLHDRLSRFAQPPAAWTIGSYRRVRGTAYSLHLYMSIHSSRPESVACCRAACDDHSGSSISYALSRFISPVFVFSSISVSLYSRRRRCRWSSTNDQRHMHLDSADANRAAEAGTRKTRSSPSQQLGQFHPNTTVDGRLNYVCMYLHTADGRGGNYRGDDDDDDGIYTQSEPRWKKRDEN